MMERENGPASGIIRKCPSNIPTLECENDEIVNGSTTWSAELEDVSCWKGHSTKARFLPLAILLTERRSQLY